MSSPCEYLETWEKPGLVLSSTLGFLLQRRVSCILSVELTSPIDTTQQQVNVAAQLDNSILFGLCTN